MLGVVGLLDAVDVVGLLDAIDVVGLLDAVDVVDAVDAVDVLGVAGMLTVVADAPYRPLYLAAGVTATWHAPVAGAGRVTGGDVETTAADIGGSNARDSAGAAGATE